MKHPLLLIFLLILMTGCSSQSVSTMQATNTVVPTKPLTATSVPPTFTPEATATFTPEPTATIVPTTTSENQIFRDDFSGTLQPGWIWENENSDRWIITSDGWLQILGEDTALLYGQAQSNLLWRELPQGNFVITVHLKAIPVANFQQATIYLYEDSQNFVAINRGYCAPCKTRGNGVYMEYKIGGAGGVYIVALQETDLYLRLEFKTNVITGSFATKPDQWQRLGRFGNYFLFKRAGLGVTNGDAESDDNADLVGLFDYFEITRP